MLREEPTMNSGDTVDTPFRFLWIGNDYYSPKSISYRSRHSWAGMRNSEFAVPFNPEWH